MTTRRFAIPKPPESGSYGLAEPATPNYPDPNLGVDSGPVSVPYPTNSGGNSKAADLGPVPACELFYEPSLDGKEAMRWPRRF